MSAKESIHGSWSSGWAFMLAATGSAVGLGNIWKFPYITGQNGGAAFVMVYLLCVLLIGIPVMIAEITLGRRGRQSPMNTMYTLAIESGHSPLWKYLGFMGVFAGFIILSYYSVIAGWAVYYMILSSMSEFTGITAAGANAKFGNFTQDPVYLLFFHTIFMLMTMYVVSLGVRSGLEKATKFMMPALFVILLILDGYAMNTNSFDKGVGFLFQPDFSKLTWSVVLTAMGHAFFTLSLGMGAIMVYGSYMPKRASIAKASFVIAIADVLVALLAGIAIFPVVFANGLEPSSGPGLLFITLPLAFGHMPWGALFGTLFFILVTFAAWTSSISLLEPAVTWLVENHRFKRIKATFVAGLIIWVLGIFTVFSFNKWAFKFTLIGKTYENGFFNIFDILTANIMLPLGGMLIAIFAGWYMSQQASRDELEVKEWMYMTWRFLVRYISPFAILIVFLNVIGVIKL
ncbi:MAG: sodium-dependent transporter [Gammaproteobacteria bacterium]|nr:sodium-dependent transporter [Gammaproteobacteria bacterium]